MKQIIIFLYLIAISNSLQAEIKLGLNYPKSGPYETQGLDQLRSAELAVKEINAKGGVLGQKLKLVVRDSHSKPAETKRNVIDLIDNEKVSMIFGGSSSGVAAVAAREARKRDTLFFGTLTYSNDITIRIANKLSFRECYHSHAAAQVLGAYLNKNHKHKKYFYVTAKYNWGKTTEDSFRKVTETDDLKSHGRAYTPFPGATESDFLRALKKAAKSEPEVLVLVLFGNDMAQAVRLIDQAGFKKRPALIVPNLTLGMVEAAGYDKLEGVVGALPWTWKVPYKYGYETGKKYVEAFKKAHSRYPSTSGASAYTIVHEYAKAVERAKSTNSFKVSDQLAGHKYTFLKDEQEWADFNHQSRQTVYAVKVRKAADIAASELKMDYFEIIHSIPADQAFLSKAKWDEMRKSTNSPLTLN